MRTAASLVARSGRAWIRGVLRLMFAVAVCVLTGWGVREAVLVFALGLGGVAAHDALAVSVTWGALLLALGLLALPPSLYFLRRR